MTLQRRPSLPRFVLQFALAWMLQVNLAHAQTDPASAIQQNLYQDALQSIAEGRRTDGAETLKRMIEMEPQHAGAWLDLALTQCALGHADEAERMFAIIETRFNPPPGILEIIAKARDQGCDTWHPQSSATLTLGRGNDHNVNQGASNPNYVANLSGIPVTLPLLPGFLPQHDQYTVLSADYVRDATANGSVAFAQFQARENDHLKQYDTDSLLVGVQTPWRHQHWTLQDTASVGFISLGGQLYERLTQLQARVGPPLPLPNSTQFTVLGEFNHTDYPTLPYFNADIGEIRAQLIVRQDTRAISASMGFLDDRAGVQRPGGNRHGILTNILVRQQLHAGLIGELAFTRQTWQSQSSYSPGLIDEIPYQATEVLRTTFIHPITKSQSLQLEVRAVQNRENISIFEYNDRQIQLSWQWHIQ